MRIGVCFKIVPDFEDTASSEWENPQNLDFSYVKKIYGCYDEAALETALRLRDSMVAVGQAVYTVAVTVGAPNSATAESSLKALFAAGFDDVVAIDNGIDFCPQYTARVLADYFRKNPVDIVFCGKMVGPCDSGMVPVYLAKELEYEFMHDVAAAAFAPDLMGISVVTKDSRFRKRWMLAEPTVCTVGDADASYLRLFPLKARMEAARKTITHLPKSVQSQVPQFVLAADKKKGSFCRYIDKDCAARELIDILKGKTER